MDKIIDTFSKNTMEEVRTRLTEYLGHKLIDIRVWYKREDKDPLATKKGITLGIDHYKELKEAILKVGDELEGKA